jgi:predicted CopG family antitoxin
MATTKVSITIDTERLEELKRLSDAGVSLSAVIDEAVRRELKRLQMIAILEEMDRENPISDEARKAGEESWERFESSSTQVPSPPSRKNKASQGPNSRKR